MPGLCVVQEAHLPLQQLGLRGEQHVTLTAQRPTGNEVWVGPTAKGLICARNQFPIAPSDGNIYILW